jgi:hypothetical protein
LSTIHAGVYPELLKILNNPEQVQQARTEAIKNANYWIELFKSVKVTR